METIELALDESNDLTFQVVVQGAQESTTKVRFVVEGAGGALHSFLGSRTPEGNVSVTMPSLKPVLGEGVRPAWLEVIADDRFFVPLHVQVDLRESVKVSVVSVVSVNESKRSAKVQAGATATLVVSSPVKKAAPTVVNQIPVKAAPKKVAAESRKPLPARNAQRFTQDTVIKTESTLSDDQLRDVVKDLLKVR